MLQDHCHWQALSGEVVVSQKVVAWSRPCNQFTSKKSQKVIRQVVAWSRPCNQFTSKKIVRLSTEVTRKPRGARNGVERPVKASHGAQPAKRMMFLKSQFMVPPSVASTVAVSREPGSLPPCAVRLLGSGWGMYQPAGNTTAHAHARCQRSER
jgi:hypothetical protein